jgi:hypothetical protein
MISVVYIIALCSSLNTTTFCFLYICTYVHLTDYNGVGFVHPSKNDQSVGRSKTERVFV